MSSKPLTVINVFTVEPARQQQLIELLSRATDESVRMPWGSYRRDFIEASMEREVTMYPMAQQGGLPGHARGPAPLPYLEQALAIAKFEPGM